MASRTSWCCALSLMCWCLSHRNKWWMTNYLVVASWVTSFTAMKTLDWLWWLENTAPRHVWFTWFCGLFPCCSFSLSPGLMWVWGCLDFLPACAADFVGFSWFSSEDFLLFVLPSFSSRDDLYGELVRTVAPSVDRLLLTGRLRTGIGHMDAALIRSDWILEGRGLPSASTTCGISEALLSASTSGKDIADGSTLVALSWDDSSDCTSDNWTVDRGLSVTSDGANSLYTRRRRMLALW